MNWEGSGPKTSVSQGLMSVCVQCRGAKSARVASSGRLSWLRECVIAWNVRSAAPDISSDSVRTPTARISSRSRQALTRSGRFTVLVSRHRTGVVGVGTNSRPMKSLAQHTFGVTDRRRRSFDGHRTTCRRFEHREKLKGRPQGAAFAKTNKPTRRLPRGPAVRTARRSCHHRSREPSIPLDADTSPALRGDECCDCSGNRGTPPRAG